MAVFPGAKVIPNCVNKYPIAVDITCTLGATSMKVWSGSQKKLFSKYAADRTATINIIQSSLMALREDLGMDDA